MQKKDKLLIFVSCIIFVGCNSGAKPARLELEPVISSVYSPNEDYRNALSEWKNYYSHCTNEQLFPDAFYFQLQDRLYIGSISNQHTIDINRGIVILDTSNKYGNIFNLLSIKNAFNCYDSMALLGNLKTTFYNEVVNALNASAEFKGIAPAIDTTGMKVRISTLYTMALIPENLVQLIDSTKNPSLIRFKELLLTPGNVLLAETVDIFGFIAEFPQTEKIPAALRQRLAKEVLFDLPGSRDNGSIVLLSNNHLRFQLNKRYTVLGKFLQLKKI